jgi:heterodisulfide reductase subunit A2
MKKYLIVGAGISGCTAAYALAEKGHETVILEKESLAGGKVLDYCCKATDSCSRCGVCVAHTQIRDVLAHPKVTLVPGFERQSVSKSGQKVTVKGVQKYPYIDYHACEKCGACVEACPEGCITKYHRGDLVEFRIDYDKCLLHKGEKCNACVAACDSGAIQAGRESAQVTFTGSDILVATGHEVFDAVQKPRYGYSRSEKIVTGEEAEKLLSGRRELNGAKDIAFIQCVGSRDPVLGRNYCSAVCCSYALRLARVLKYNNPDTAVTIYYIDIQNFDKEYNLMRKELEDSGVKFRRGLPFLIEETAEGQLRFMIENMEDEESVIYHDLAVLSVGMGPTAGAGEVAETFDIDQDEFGFYSSSSNVFMSGTCSEPQSIPDSMRSARAVAIEMSGGDRG